MCCYLSFASSPIYHSTLCCTIHTIQYYEGYSSLVPRISTQKTQHLPSSSSPILHCVTPLCVMSINDWSVASITSRIATKPSRSSSIRSLTTSIGALTVVCPGCSKTSIAVALKSITARNIQRVMSRNPTAYCNTALIVG